MLSLNTEGEVFKYLGSSLQGRGHYCIFKYRDVDLFDLYIICMCVHTHTHIYIMV